MKIYLSPSNQDNNAYSYGNLNEMQVCNKIAIACETYLKASGFTVKRAAQGQNMYTSIEESNTWGADLHICIHTNAGGGKGCEVYTYAGTKTVNKWAEPIYNCIAAITESSDRGLKTANFAELKGTKCPCVYCECEFHDNVTTAKWIIEHTDDLGKAIATGVCKAEGVTLKSASTASATTGSKLYRVQVGAFSVKENADAYLEKLKKAGFEGFIVEVSKTYTNTCSGS
jgi:N-acetylmuramoyl-L-alanine amidase